MKLYAGMLIFLLLAFLILPARYYIEATFYTLLATLLADDVIRRFINGRP